MKITLTIVGIVLAALGLLALWFLAKLILVAIIVYGDIKKRNSVGR